MEHNFQNPHPDINKREYCDSITYDMMMNLLHSDASKTPRLYYCARCHSIETVSTFEHHKENPNCVVFTKGQFTSTILKLKELTF